MHAFIIEDEYLIARSLQDALEDLGFTTFGFARSEDAAVMGARAQKIDLITADGRLLPGDGLRAVDLICEDRDIPVIFITGYAPELENRLRTDMQRTRVLQKPIKPAELEEAVRELVSALPRQNCMASLAQSLASAVRRRR